MNSKMNPYLSGKTLYGDNFSITEIERWFEDEKEGYADLGAKDQLEYRYVYHQLNRYHGYSNVKWGSIKVALGLGSAYGDEFFPIINQLDRVTILDPSEAFSKTRSIQGVPVNYVKPQTSGNMPFENQSFDLITCFGVLHHIPNVSHVISECYRCLRPQKYMLVREPIVSMGDWTYPRKGLTKRERGIPHQLFKDIILNAGFQIKHEAFCFFHVLPYLTSFFKFSAYNNKIATAVDAWLCSISSSNTRYHRTNLTHKLGPGSVFFVLTK